MENDFKLLAKLSIIIHFSIFNSGSFNFSSISERSWVDNYRKQYEKKNTYNCVIYMTLICNENKEHIELLWFVTI